MNVFHFFTMAALSGSLLGQDITLESKRFHLGKLGQFEWSIYEGHAVDAERLEKRFEAKTNAQPLFLRLWQKDVKLSWPVFLNDKKLGSLTTAEMPLECILKVPVGALKDGENVLRIDAPPALDDIEIGPVVLTAQDIGGAKIDVVVTNDMPCRITLTRPDGTLQPLKAEPAAQVAARTGVVYTPKGRVTIDVPPGDYVLHAGRGFEWSAERQTLSVKAGEVKVAKFELKREVDTRGWIAVDSHIHTLTHSGHGDATIDERMLTIAGEGIELAISTDHNHHTDYAPAAAKMEVAQHFTPVIGNEVTTKHGHFNAFPVQSGAKVVDPNEQDWSRLLPAICATPGVEVITLNHPRDLHSGFVPLGGVMFNAQTGKHRHAGALSGLNALEVITSAAMQSDIELLYRDWFALLNRGHRIFAVGSSDSHDVNRFILGQGRTYALAKDDDPAAVNLGEVWRSYHEGRLLVSLGLLVTMTVDGRFGIGDIATGLGGALKIECVIQSPSWTLADKLQIFANGQLVHERAIADEKRITWTMPKPLHDVHLVAIATGPGVTEPFWEIPRPYQPSSKTFTPLVIGSTNPIWIDADGDGRFESAYEIAKRLIEQGGSIEKHDAAVKAQADGL
jgi:hypothetical protein